MPRSKATQCPSGHPYTPENTYVYAGRQHCRTCRRARSRQYDKEQGTARKRLREQAYRADPKNRERMAVIRRRQYVKATFGLTLEEYDAAVARGCAICGATERIFMDHDHATGAVRDALCSGCNTALGMMKDDPIRLRAAADYLESHGGGRHS